MCLSVCEPASIQEWAIAVDTRAKKGNQLSFEFQTEIGESGHLLHARLNLPTYPSPWLCGGGEVSLQSHLDLQPSRVPAFKLQPLRALPASEAALNRWVQTFYWDSVMYFLCDLPNLCPFTEVRLIPLISIPLKSELM